MLKVKLLRESAIAPTKAYPGDAGYDVYTDEDFYVTPFGNFKVPLGFAMELPDHWVGIITEKSGLAMQNMIHTIGNIIDCNYRGEVHAILMNNSHKTVQFKKGQKVAQMLIMPCYTGNDLVIVTELSDSTRGERGFGSSGK